jgi:hypothetical protein
MFFDEDRRAGGAPAGLIGLNRFLGTSDPREMGHYTRRSEALPGRPPKSPEGFDWRLSKCGKVLQRMKQTKCRHGFSLPQSRREEQR